MSTKNLALRIMGGLMVIAILAGCSTPTPAPTVDVRPTLIAVQTQAAGTVIADLTKNAPTATKVTPATATATLAPTATNAPSSTPLPTATVTPTYIPWTLTPTQAAWSCVITDFSPKLNTTFALDVDFDATWVIKNTGKQYWVKSDIDIKYSSGTKFQKFVNGLDLKNDVASGASYTAAVDMHTPKTAGTYTTTWAVSRGDDPICTMVLTIIVK